MFGIPSQLLLVIVCGFILLITVILSIMRDARAVRSNALLTRLFIQKGKQHSKKSMTVLIYLDKRADSIIPLLDQLYQQQYKKLEVIVIIKQTAGKNARPQLTAYKRTHRLALRLVTYRAGMNDASIVKKYAKNEWVISLRAPHTLGKDFFSMISFDALLSAPDAIIPKFYTRLDSTIRTAIGAYGRFVFAQTFEFDTALLQPGVVYKRQSILKDPTAPHAVSSINAYLTTSEKQPLAQVVRVPTPGFLKAGAAIVAAGLLGFVVAQMAGTEQTLVIATVIGAVLYLFASKVLVSDAYSVMDKINLILLSPVFLGYRAALTGFVIVRMIVSTLKRSVFLILRRANA